MDAIHFIGEQARLLAEVPEAIPSSGWIWLDAQHEEVAHQTEKFRNAVAGLTGVRIFDLHLTDAINLQHPSYHDSTRNYDMVVFRKLTTGDTEPLSEIIASNTSPKANSRRVLQKLSTRPITFFVFDRVLVTVRSAHSQVIEQARHRLLEHSTTQESSNEKVADKQRLPMKPDELMMRLLNNMVDRYLDLRQPLNAQLDRWQRELLDPARPFDNWTILLDARNELRKLEYLCEEQHDALQELRDSYIDSSENAQLNDAYLVRINDVMEHINRVLNHARRLELSIETAVQLHFSAVSHRTNQIVQSLTVITAIFAPLTLITGIFGMNFNAMPFIQQAWGFWATISAMGFIAILLLLFFWGKRYLRLHSKT